MSRVSLHEHNMVSADLHFGCGIYVYKQDAAIKTGNDQVDQLFELLQTFSQEPEKSENWSPFRSFFISLKLEIELNTEDEAKHFAPLGVGGINMVDKIPAIFAKIVRFDPYVSELKVYNGDIVMKDEAEALNKSIMDLKNLPKQTPVVFKPLLNLVTDQGWPIVPFPSI